MPTAFTLDWACKLHNDFQVNHSFNTRQWIDLTKPQAAQAFPNVCVSEGQ